MWLALLLAPLIFAGGVWTGLWWNSDSDTSLPTLRSAAAAYITSGDTVSASGKIQPSHLVDVGAQVSGQLTSLHVQIGDVVSKDDLIAEIDATIQENQVAETEAYILVEQKRMEAQNSALLLAQTEHDRLNTLHLQGNTSLADLERARDSLLRAQLGVAQYERQLESWNARLSRDRALLSYTNIYAPIDGTVMRLYATEGQTLTSTYVTPLILTIADLSKMSVETRVSEYDVSKLTPGMGVRFTTRSSGSREWRSVLDIVEPIGESSSNLVTYTAKFQIGNNDGALRPGMTATVFFEISEPERYLAVPLEMVSNIGVEESDEGTSAEVMVQSEDGSPLIKRILVGRFTHTHAEVLDGLSEGERVVLVQE